MCSSWLPPFLLIYMVPFSSSKGTACYHCVSLNYRTTIPSRNGPLPPPQDGKNLSELFQAMQHNSVRVPPLVDSCADLPANSAPNFIQAPVVLCRHSYCVKLKFKFKEENAVVRNCASELFTDTAIMRKFDSNCHEQLSEISLGALANISLCECERDLCNSFTTKHFGTALVLAILTYSSNVFAYPSVCFTALTSFGAVFF